MKQKFLNFSLNIIKKYGHYTQDQLEIIEYGLEGIYLTMTKMVVLFCLALILGIIKEYILLLLSYNIIRSQAFGVHASKSIYCWISSTILFIGGAFICKYVTIPFNIAIIIAFICDICLLLYAPADTYKHPLINAKKRKRWKLISFCLGIIYTLLIIYFKDSSIVNYFVIGMFEAVLMIIPVTYQIFHLPYNNYKTYNCGV